MTTNPRILKLLDDIHKSATRIVECLKDETLESFSGETSLTMQDVVARRLTIIGEASAALLKKFPEFCEENAHIPLRQARGLRNILVHEYDNVDWQAVWHDCKRELPMLIAMIAPLLQKNEKDCS